MSGIIGQGTKSGIIGLSTLENSISDYEQGTFSATAGQGSNTSMTGKYRKFGKMVYIEIPVFNTGMAFWTITGLPFTTDPTGWSGYSALSFGRALQADNLDGNSANKRVYASGTTVHIYNNGGTGAGGDGYDSVTTGSGVSVRLSITGWYPIA